MTATAWNAAFVTRFAMTYNLYRKAPFNKLFTITNLPLSRFASHLRDNNKPGDYMFMLKEAFNPSTVEA